MIEYTTAFNDLIKDAQDRRPNDRVIKASVMDDPLNPFATRLLVEYESHSKRVYCIDPTDCRPSKPKRLRCEYCGRVATTGRPTCEGCGAVLPWEIDYEA